MRKQTVVSFVVGGSTRFCCGPLYYECLLLQLNFLPCLRTSPLPTDERREKKCVLKMKFCYRFYAIVKMGKKYLCIANTNVIRCKQGRNISIRSNGAKRTEILKSAMNLRLTSISFSFVSNVLRFAIYRLRAAIYQCFHQKGLNYISHFACCAASVLDCKNNCICGLTFRYTLFCIVLCLRLRLFHYYASLCLAVYCCCTEYDLHSNICCNFNGNFSSQSSKVCLNLLFTKEEYFTHL